jgi:DNA (cytosine-5)-methyltransferase 1
MRTLGPDEQFLLVYYGTDGAGGWQALGRPLRTITTLDRFALVRPNGDGYEMRMLQPPELAAAMGCPAGYVWPETARRNKIKMIGNAVCPPVMQAIVSHLVKK